MKIQCIMWNNSLNAATVLLLSRTQCHLVVSHLNNTLSNPRQAEEGRAARIFTQGRVPLLSINITQVRNIYKVSVINNKIMRVLECCLDINREWKLFPLGALQCRGQLLKNAKGWDTQKDNNKKPLSSHG